MSILSRLSIALSVAAVICVSSVADASLESLRAPSASPDTADLVLSFSEKVDVAATTVQVQDASGQRVWIGELLLDENGTDIRVPLSGPLAPGVYGITWRAVSTRGKVQWGGYSFTVEPSIDTAPAIARQ